VFTTHAIKLYCVINAAIPDSGPTLGRKIRAIMTRTSPDTDPIPNIPQSSTRDYIIEMSEELAGLAAKSGLPELESILRLAKLTARQPGISS